MKKIYTLGLTALAVLAFFNANAQIYTPSGLIGQTAGGSGNGVGTDTPGAMLHVKGFEGPLFLLDPEYMAIVNGWTYPESLLSIKGLTGTQSTSGPPSFGEIFHVAANGNTQIGEFPSAPSNTLSVRSSFGIYASNTTWMRLIFSSGSTSGNSPELTWRAGDNIRFRIRNDQTDVTALTLDKEGKVGVGTNTLTGDHALFVEGTAVTDKIYVQQTSEWGEDNDYIEIKHTWGPEIKWKSSEGENFRFFSNGNNVMHLSPEGKVGIGTDNFVGDHSLYVAGSMIMEEGFVKIQDNWPDYVFAPGYALMPLNEVGEYIQDNGHLPGMPSAAQVAEEGLAVGETQRLLTEKVEELTLYLLRMNEEMEALREEITTLKGEK